MVYASQATETIQSSNATFRSSSDDTLAKIGAGLALASLMADLGGGGVAKRFVRTTAVGDVAKAFVSRAAAWAEYRVAQRGLQGSLGTARAAAQEGQDILPGLFQYDSGRVRIPGYDLHHLWPKALGGPEDGWAVYAKQPHTTLPDIQGRLNEFLRKQTGMSQRDVEAWARANPVDALYYLRQFYKQENIPFPY